MAIKKLECGVSKVSELVESVNELAYPATAKHSPIMTKVSSPSDLSLLTGDATFEQGIAPNGREGVKITCTSESRISVNSAAGLYFDGYLSAAVFGGRAEGVESIRLEAFESAADNKRWFQTYTTSSNPENNPFEQGGAFTVAFGRNALGGLNAPSESFYTDKVEVRLTPVALQTAVLWLFGVSVLSNKRKSRICIVYDDGFKSSLTLGLHPWASKGIPATVSVIPGLVEGGGSGYMDKADLRQWLNSGNAIVAHGPSDGAGSLIDNYSDPATRVQLAVGDMEGTVQWIKDNGLRTPYFDRCYVWPQGKFQWAEGDRSLLDAALSSGFNTARAAVPTAASNHRNWDGLTKYNRLAVPHIGHNWSGSTANEVGNIGDIVSAINALSDAGGVDFHLMLHKVVDDSTPDGDMDISIRVSDLETIAQAVKNNVDAGKLEAVTMPQTAVDDNYWNQF